MSDSLNSATILSALEDFQDPETGRSAVKLGQVQNLKVSGKELDVTLALTTSCAPVWKETRDALAERLRATFPGLDVVRVHDAIFDRPAERLGEVGLQAKHVLAVGSGKGGVGKSTIATAIAFGLHRAGCKVGLMDADVYGPSIPHLLGLSGRPEIDQELKKIIPKRKEGMPVMSMGLLVAADEAVVWRGPMLHGAITQFLRDTLWGDLDYLVIDMPPGTGDIALTLSQSLSSASAVVVCTPQDVALLDAVKAITMFRKVNIPILGVVENMSGFVCPQCDQMHYIFGKGGARRRAEEMQIPFLGEVPLNIQIRESGDAQDAVAMFGNEIVRPYLDRIAYQIVKNLVTAHRAAPPLPKLNVL